MSSTVRISIAFFIGYTAYLAVDFLLGNRPDEAVDWVRLVLKGVLIVAVAVSVVEWANRRNAAARVNSQMSSESRVPQPTVSGPPTAG
ncbi:hypothetical protein [Nocardia pseudovaccinii]|uniref:hypothetical protein n=1 Tax=Nocardia pseudovaccinii TaxID=189540 RepID=UPI0012F50B30|nr:hypothetical protein [Nocardia pseudovaccinii]